MWEYGNVPLMHLFYVAKAKGVQTRFLKQIQYLPPKIVPYLQPPLAATWELVKVAGSPQFLVKAISRHTLSYLLFSSCMNKQ